jgi:DNA-binding NtrC family response regulator
MPSLRERREDIAALVEFIIERVGGHAKDGRPGLSAAALEALSGYSFPGNVRELEQAVRRVILTGSYQPDRPPTAPKDAWLRAIAEGQLSAQQLLADYCYRLYQQLGSYERVAEQAGLDRRTAKKYIDQARLAA